uniref:Si:dkey-16l2.20 n=1 Tax=Poecilia formosa TaxID=48698 RepID=A0A087Y619_POEFO
NHRKLAICSIICGCSCVGYKALENSFQVDQQKNREQKLKYSKEAKKYGIISIVTLFGILILIPVLLVFVSYLLTLKD